MATDIQNWQNTFRNTTPVNRGIWGSAMNRSMFTPQALNAFRSVAASPLGTVGRYALGIPGAVAATPFLARSGINYLTERDPNATRSSLFNIDLTKNANEGAALPGSTLNDWGSEMGPIPDGGVVPPTKKINTPLNKLDPNWQHQLKMQDIDRGNIDNRFSFDPRNWGVMGLMKRMVEPNTPEENFGRGYFKDTMDSSGRVYNDAGDLFGGKNVVSAYGKGMGAAGQKRLDTIENTLRTKYNLGDEEIEDVYAGTYTGPIKSQLIQRLQNFKKQLAQYNKDLAAGTGDQGTTITTTQPGTGGPTGDGASRDQGGGYTTRGGFTGTRGQEPGSRGGATSGSGRGHHSWRAEGGRIGYKEKGFVDPDEVDDLDIFEFMQDQGVNYDQMAEAVPQEFPSDDLGAINLNEEQIAIISDLNDKGMDVSLISTISGAGEDAVERFIRLLNAKAQGGSVGYFNGGLASIL